MTAVRLDYAVTRLRVDAKTVSCHVAGTLTVRLCQRRVTNQQEMPY